jgi:hypothetical protein
MSIALSFNDDNDKHKSNKNKKKRLLSKRVDVTHVCNHKMSYPSNPKFDYSIKDSNCPMCQEWDNPKDQLEEDGDLL